MTTADDDAVRELLAAAPRPPLDPNLFSSNVLFGEPGIYPQGTPMVPAAGAALDRDAARDALAAVGLVDAVARFDDPTLVALVPGPGPRAGLASLVGTIGEPLLDAFVAGQTEVRTIEVGEPTSPGRVIGPALDATADHATRVVNDRYRAEHPALLALSLTHDLLWNPTGSGQYEECILHALGAMVHLQLLARAPALARTGTELARRQNSLVITLLNSRDPGSADLSLIAPDGAGTIPGGASNMQTPDFWSIPFVSGTPVASPAPSTLAAVLECILEPATPLPNPLQFDAALGRVLSDRLGRGWLSLHAQLAAARALGALP